MHCVGLSWVGLNRNFPRLVGWVVDVSLQVAKTKFFHLLSIWSVKHSLSYSLSTRVKKYSVSTAIVVGFYTSVI